MTSEDAVKREAVLNTLDMMDKVLDENRTVEAYKELLKECYKELPPVTPKPKTGHWIKICPMVVDGGLAKRIKCSECGDERLDYFISKRYCPNCGAKMEGEE